MNKIQHVLVSRLRQLYETIDESSSITHNPTKGSLRESYLRNFITNILPSDLSIGSGFICDCYGGISPQIDFILADKSKIPSLALIENVALVPIETALLTIEMKSNITTGSLEQLKKQYNEINKLRLVRTFKSEAEETPIQRMIPVLISLIGLESKVKKETLSNWFKEFPQLLSICVVGNYSLTKKDFSKPDTGLIEGQDFTETLQYFSALINVCYDIIEYNEKNGINSSFRRSWVPYIVGTGTIKYI